MEFSTSMQSRKNCALGGIHQALLWPLEVVLDMTLAADEGAHLLPRRHGVDPVVRHTLDGLEGTDALDKAGARHSQLRSTGHWDKMPTL
jgi:hypothetical protein